MNCKKCNRELETYDVSAEFVDMSDGEKIEVIVECQECETQHYTFIILDDLITDKDYG